MRRFEAEAKEVALSVNMVCDNPIAFAGECKCEGCVEREEIEKIVTPSLQKAYNEGIEASAKIAEASSHVCEYPFPPQDEIASAIRKQLGGA